MPRSPAAKYEPGRGGRLRHKRRDKPRQRPEQLHIPAVGSVFRGLGSLIIALDRGFTDSGIQACQLTSGLPWAERKPNWKEGTMNQGSAHLSAQRPSRPHRARVCVCGFDVREPL